MYPIAKTKIYCSSLVWGYSGWISFNFVYEKNISASRENTCWSCQKHSFIVTSCELKRKHKGPYSLLCKPLVPSTHHVMQISNGSPACVTTMDFGWVPPVAACSIASFNNCIAVGFILALRVWCEIGVCMFQGCCQCLGCGIWSCKQQSLSTLVDFQGHAMDSHTSCSNRPPLSLYPRFPCPCA